MDKNKIITIDGLEGCTPEDMTIEEAIAMAKAEFNVDLEIFTCPDCPDVYNASYTVSGLPDNVKQYLEYAFYFEDGDISGYYDPVLEELFNVHY